MDKSQPARNLQPILTFYLLAFAISWTGYLPPLVGQWGVHAFEDRRWLVTTILMAVGPALAAWLVSDQPFPALWQAVRGRWLAFAAIVPALVLLASNAFSRCTVSDTRRWPLAGGALLGRRQSPWRQTSGRRSAGAASR